MSDFETKDGVKVATLPTGGLIVDGEAHVNAKAVRALREYFQAEDPRLVQARARWQHQEDARLGRWRWPEDLDYVVYASGPDQAVVLEEGSGISRYFWRASVHEAPWTGHHARLNPAARAYFDAHPEPKPWHEAKPGEAWEISLDNVVEFVALRDHDAWYATPDGYRVVETSDIVRARRVWPEATS